MENQIEAQGRPPEFVFDPRSVENEDSSPAISARFFLGPDPRTDPVGNNFIGENGAVPTIEMVEIINRNDQKNSPAVNISTDIHRYKMFPREYAAFRNGLNMQGSGIPIKEWLGENARTQNLATFHIHTVEQLAAASDSLCQTLGPGTYDLRKRAQTHLQVHKGDAVAERAIAENATLRREMEELKAQTALLLKAVEAKNANAPEQIPEEHPATIDPLELPQKRGPGRPPRNQGE